MPVLIIAEAGVNHNGDLEMAKRMALVAKECGADVVKYQTVSGGSSQPAHAGTAFHRYEQSQRDYRCAGRSG